MPKPPAPLRPREPPQPQPADIAPIEHPRERAAAEAVGFPNRDRDEAPVRGSVRPGQKSAKRRWDRYDYIGAAIVAFLVALWAVHFSLPTLPPDNVNDANQPIGRN